VRRFDACDAFSIDSIANARERRTWREHESFIRAPAFFERDPAENASIEIDMGLANFWGLDRLHG
jgi:hypothetical protein